VANPAAVADQERGKSWPLMLLAALSLIPVLGFLFGFAAACWGLVTDRPRGILAAALGGTGALLNLVVLAVVGLSQTTKGQAGGLAGAIARTELDTLVSHLDRYHHAHGRYPARLADLPQPAAVGARLPVLDHSIGLLNTTIEYAYEPDKNGAAFRIRGAGKDGITDTPDDILPTGWDNSGGSDTTVSTAEALESD
jgi:hypothetical protein